MQEDRMKPGYKMLDCAFSKFLALRYPVFIKYYVYPPMHRNSVHNHDFPQMWYCLNGRYQHRIEDRIYECGKGSVVVIPPGVFHQLCVPVGESPEIVHLNVMYDIFLETPLECYTNAMANLFLPPFEKELGYTFPRYLMLSKESQAALEEYISWFAALNFQMPGETPVEKIYEKLEELYSLPEFALPQEYHAAAQRLVQVRVRPMVRVLHYLNTHYQEKIVEEDVLRVSATCHANLYRYFKRFTGYTFPVYLQWLRIKRVFSYLTFTTYPISYISDICGFPSQAYMTQVFTKLMRSTPRRARIEQKQYLEATHQMNPPLGGP